MLRAIIYMLLGVLAISFVRGVLGILAKGVGEAMRGATEGEPVQPNQPSQAKRGDFGGALVKDPVCGTFVSQQSKFAKTVNGATHHFCSQACADKFAA